MQNNKKVVYTSGTWDLFHIGHLNVLKRSKALGDTLIVGVSTDELVESYKKSPPVISYDERVKILESLDIVDKVVRQDILTNPDTLVEHKVDIVTIGDDWEGKYLEGLEWAKRQPNIGVVYLPYTKHISSTYIKQKIKDGWQEDRESVSKGFSKGKNVLITGASSGIGESIARKFAEKGYNIGLHYFKEEENVKKIRDELSSLTKVRIYQQDFSSDKIDLVQRFVEDFGSVDILVNNAGVMAESSFFNMSAEEYNRIFFINSRASFIVSRDAFANMKENNYGRILNIGSFVVKYGMGRNSSIHYAASKSTLDVLTTGLAREGAKYNILVNSIRPGVINTKMQRDRLGLKERVDMIPVGRMGDAKDIAEMVVYLVEKGGFITGQIITISGGE